MTVTTDRQPTPANIRQARLNSSLSETAASEVIYVSRQSWRLYENGDVQMKLGLWELFLFKTGQIWLKPNVAKKPRAKARGRIENLRPFTAQNGRSE